MRGVTMKKLVSLILLFAIFSSLILPVYAENEYTASIIVEKTSYMKSEPLNFDVKVFKDRNAAGFVDVVYKVTVGDKVLANSGRTGSDGVVSFTESLASTPIGAGKIEIFKDNRVIASASIKVANNTVSFIGLSKDKAHLGDSIELTGQFYSEGKIVASRDLVYSVEKNGSPVFSDQIKTDSSGRINESINLDNNFSIGTYTVEVTYNNETLTKSFEILEKEATLSSVHIMNKVTNLLVGESHTPVLEARYSDASKKDVEGSYTSSNASIVVENNKIVAKEAGSATITGTFEGKTDTMTINVSEVEKFTVTTDKSVYEANDIVKVTVKGESIVNRVAVIRVYDGNNKIVDQLEETLTSTSNIFDIQLNDSFAAGTFRAEVTIRLEEVDEQVVTSFDVNAATIGSDIELISSFTPGSKLTVRGVLVDEEGIARASRAYVIQLKYGDDTDSDQGDTDYRGYLLNDKFKLNYGTGTYAIEIYEENKLRFRETFEVSEARVTSIEFVNTSTSVRVPGSMGLNVQGTKSDGSKVMLSSQVTYELSNANASVSGSTLTARSQGSVIVTAKYEGLSATHTVSVLPQQTSGNTDSGNNTNPGTGSGSVTPPPAPAPSTGTTSTPSVSIRLDRSEIELEYGTTSDPSFYQYDLTETITNSNDSEVTWSVADSDIATVDENGLVRAVSAGNTSVTVTHVASGRTATARVIVFLVGEEQTPLGAIQFNEPFMSGYPDNTFGPLRPVTRAEVATMFSKVLKLNLDHPGDQKFADVNEGDWYYTYVQAIQRTGLFVGDDKGDFRPNDPISRGEIATVFTKYWRFLNIDVEDTKVSISDVKDSHWASEYIYTMFNAGITPKFDDGTYRPDDPTLREQIVGMINTLIDRPAFNAPQSKFTDIDKEHWAYGDIEAASQMFIGE